MIPSNLLGNRRKYVGTFINEPNKISDIYFYKLTATLSLLLCHGCKEPYDSSSNDQYSFIVPNLDHICNAPSVVSCSFLRHGQISKIQNLPKYQGSRLVQTCPGSRYSQKLGNIPPSVCCQILNMSTIYFPVSMSQYCHCVMCECDNCIRRRY